MTEVVVAGGGLAGLVAARHLAAAGVDVQLYERRETVGGRVRTVREDGYRFDRGFQVLFTAYPAAQRELDLDALDLRYFLPGATIARPGKRSVLSDPLRDFGAISESLFNTEVTFGDKLRVLKLRRDLARKSREDVFSGPDESIREYLRGRGFSRAFIENFAAPFYGGITLDRSLSTSRRVFEYTFKTLSAGEIAVPSDGMGAIPEQLADRARSAGANVETGTTVTGVDADDEGASITLGTDQTHSADAAVVATDPKHARDLTGVESIPTAKRGCVTQYYAFPVEKHLDAGKRLLLNAASERPNHVVDHTAVAPEYAPEDTTLLSATFLGEPDEDDADLAALTRDRLEAWYPEYRFDDLETVHTERVPFAQFDQPPGFRESLPAVTAPGGRAYLAGDYTAWSSISGAMESGYAAARAVLGDLEN